MKPSNPTTLNWKPPSLLPPMAGGLLIGLLIFYPIVLLGFKQFIPSLWMQAEAFSQGKGVVVAWPFILKFLIFCLLGGGALILLRLRLDVAYITHWAMQFPRPHPLHVDYHPAEPYSFYALAKWTLYRFLRLATIPCFIGLLLALSAWGQLLFLNFFLDAPLMKLPIIYILGIFWMLTLTLLLVASWVNALWQSFSSTFGVCAVITEPLKPLPILFNRCQRISTQTPLIQLLWILKSVLALLWMTLSLWLLWQYRVEDLLTPQFPWWWVLPTLLGLWLAEVNVHYLQFLIYHLALQKFYTKLPRFAREGFSPPISIFEGNP